MLLTWSSTAVTCEACHGPGSLHARDGDKTKIVMAQHAPKAPADATCATCHLPGGSHQFKKPARK